MKKTNAGGFLIFLLIANFGFLSCKKGEVIPYYKQMILLGKYKKTGTNINTASFSIDLSNVPKQIQIPSGQSYTPQTCQTSRVCISVNNVRLKDELGIYNIEKESDVVTQELQNGVWQQDVENRLTLTRTQNLDIVLVLDYSSSLGGDVVNVKQYATTFINFIKTQNTGAKVGIVIFSNTVNSLALTNNYTAAQNFINGQPSGADETKLYEAMDKGISLFQTSTAEGKALITFTDGKNNSWSTPVFSTYDPIVTKLNSTIGTPSTLISSYTIGLNGKQGGVDAAALNALAMNGGISAVAPNTNELEKVFGKFANSVSAVYTMTYSRNSSIIPNDIQLRFVINTQLQ